MTINVYMVEHLRKDVDFFIPTRNTDYGEEVSYDAIPSNEWVEFKPGVSVFYFSRYSLTLVNLKIFF